MGKAWLVALAGLLVLGGLPAQATLPESVDEFKARFAEEAKTPEGAAKLWFDALYLTLDEATRDDGAKMIQLMTIPLLEEDGWINNRAYWTFTDRIKDPNKHHIFRSYAKGTSPDNQYAMDPNDYELNIERVHQREGDDRGIQVYLRSSGADSARPVYLKQEKNTGLWYMNVYANVYVDIRPPVDPNKPQF